MTHVLICKIIKDLDTDVVIDTCYWVEDIIDSGQNQALRIFCCKMSHGKICHLYVMARS